MHRRKLYFWKQFQILKLAEKKTAVRKLRACKRCLEVNGESTYFEPIYLCKNRNGHAPEYNYYPCPNAKATKNEVKQNTQKSKSNSLVNFPLIWQSNVNFASIGCSTLNNKLNLLMENKLQELLVIMMLLEVTANPGQRIGTLIDLASDTN